MPVEGTIHINQVYRAHTSTCCAVLAAHDFDIFVVPAASVFCVKSTATLSVSVGLSVLSGAASSVSVLGEVISTSCI